MSREIKLNDIFVATPLNSEDKFKYGFRFCLVKDKDVLVISQGKIEKTMYMMEDANNVPEYYTEKHYIQKFLENKEYLFKNYKVLVNAEELLSSDDNASIELEKLVLAEKAVNELYLKLLEEESEDLVY